MRSPNTTSPWLKALAVGLAAVAMAYSVIWMVYVRAEYTAMAGFDYDYSFIDRRLLVTKVYEDTPAERAGLRADDRILAIKGRPFDDIGVLRQEVNRGQPGDRVEFLVQRPNVDETLRLEVTLVARSTTTPGLARTIALQIIYSFPILFLAVGIPVLFLRLHDRFAWLLALMFFTSIAGAPIWAFEPELPGAIRGFTVAYHLIAGVPNGAILYFFFAVFPRSSPIDRRVPWLKWVLLLPLGLLGLTLGVWSLIVGSGDPLRHFGVFVEERAPWLDPVVTSLSFGAYGLAFLSLISNTVRASDTHVRRKTRVMAWGTLVGMVPLLVLQLVATRLDRWFYDFPFWIWAPTVLLVLLVPLSFAYAVLKHRVLEVPVLLRRSARYLLVQRGFTALLILVSAAIMASVATLLSAYWQGDPSRTYGPEVSVGAGLGAGLLAVLLVWGGTRVRDRVTERLDRAFFRSAYDARQILEDLAEQSRSAAGKEDLVQLLDRQLHEALHPSSLLIFLENNGGHQLVEATGSILEVPSVSGNHPLLDELVRRGEPWEVDTGTVESGSPSLSGLESECLVPMLGRHRQLLGVLELGPRLSEESYSSEDKRLLSSVAGQAALALESFDLAAEIAERVEAERRVAQEMEIARQVQSHLFPQRTPPLKTLEYTATCIQARAVGGDYYDFLDLGDGQVGLVLADISGKGISGALLMANLQANLRSRSALARHDLAGMLRSVNDALYESTEISQFATLFFGIYDDATRRLRYVNCGHNPPLVFRSNGSVERLLATATVLGAFERWDDEIEEVGIEPGDLILIYSDGATEARDDGGAQFGEERLIEWTGRNRCLAIETLLRDLVDTVQTFNGQRYDDDLTLVVARGR